MFLELLLEDTKKKKRDILKKKKKLHLKDATQQHWCLPFFVFFLKFATIQFTAAFAAPLLAYSTKKKEFQPIGLS